MNKILIHLIEKPSFDQFCLPQVLRILQKLEIDPVEAFAQYKLEPQQISSLSNQTFFTFPFLVCNIPATKVDKLVQLAQDSVILSKVSKLVAWGNNYQHMIKSADPLLVELLCRQPATTTVACQFLYHNRVVSKEQQQASIFQVLDKLKVSGTVRLKGPQVTYTISENHDWNQHNQTLPHSQTLRGVFFGVKIADNKSKARQLMLKFALKDRIYLGPTSTDEELAHLMTAQADIHPGDLVLDPFVGTGSLLISASERGGVCFGVDLDGRVLQGSGVGRLNKKSCYYKAQLQTRQPKIMLNFEQYGLQTPQLLRSDCFKLRLRSDLKFDVLVCDPPYGIRAMSRTTDQTYEGTYKMPDKETINKLNKQKNQLKQQSRKERKGTDPQKQRRKEQWLAKEQIKEKIMLSQLHKKKLGLTPSLQHKTHPPKTLVEVNPFHIYQQLMQIAYAYLRVGGRLVFLYPVWEGTQQRLPQHPSLQIIRVCKNQLTGGCTRLCILMRKIL